MVWANYRRRRRKERPPSDNRPIIPITKVDGSGIVRVSIVNVEKIRLAPLKSSVTVGGGGNRTGVSTGPMRSSETIADPSASDVNAAAGIDTLYSLYSALTPPDASKAVFIAPVMLVPSTSNRDNCEPGDAES